MNAPASSVAAIPDRSVWTEGDRLRARDGARFPEYCVHCGEPAPTRAIARVFYWHSPWLYALILFGWIPYVIIALIARRKVRLTLSFCEEHRTSRLVRMWLGLGGAVVGAPLLCVASSAVAPTDDPTLLAVAWIAIAASAIAGLIVGARAQAVLRIERIDDRGAVFARVDSRFLARVSSQIADVFR